MKRMTPEGTGGASRKYHALAVVERLYGVAWKRCRPRGTSPSQCLTRHAHRNRFLPPLVLPEASLTFPG